MLTTGRGTNTFPSKEIHIVHHCNEPIGDRSEFLTEFQNSWKYYQKYYDPISKQMSQIPDTLLQQIASPVYNRSMGSTFTAPIVPQSTPARVSFGPTVLMTGYSLAFTPERMRGFATHSLTNNISDTNQTILISESILMLANLQAIQL